MPECKGHLHKWAMQYNQDGALDTQELPLHACPFQEDVYNDPTPTCTCCEACMAECAAEV